MFKEIQKLFSLERLETLYLVTARSDAIDARRSRYDATTYQDWFLILPFLSFTTIQFRYQTRQNSPCPAVSKNILYWYFSRYSVLFLFSMMTVSSVNPGQVHSEALKFIVVHGIVEDCILGLDALYEHRCFPSVFAVLSV